MAEHHPLTVWRCTFTPPVPQEELARKVGVSRVAITRWESGARRIPVDKVSVLSEITGLRPAELRPDLADILREPAA